MADNKEEIEVEDTDGADEEAFVTYEIASYPSDYTLSVLEEMWKNGDILVPPFQRKFVWTIKQSSLLIESLLMGLPRSEEHTSELQYLMSISSAVFCLKQK